MDLFPQNKMGTSAKNCKKLAERLEFQRAEGEELVKRLSCISLFRVRFLISPPIGWLDLVVLRYSAAVNHYTSLNLTKLDVLDSFPIIQVAVAYITPEGEKLTSFPADLSLLDKCTVEYVDFQGWQSSTKGARTWSHLPLQAQKYIEFIESLVGVKVVYIGTGQDREDMIFRE